MKIIAFTTHNQKFKHPEEDAFKYYSDKGKILVAVSDGITRDLVKGTYPNPSPAKIAADLFTNSFIKYIKKKKLTSNLIKETFEDINNKIKYLNKKKNPNPDYLVNDLWACVAVGGIIKNNYLYYGFIADCGVVIFNKNGKLKFKTRDEGPGMKGSIDNDLAKKYKTSFNETKGRKIIRSLYRNNIKNPLAYGAITGEKSFINYLRVGKIKVSKGNYVIFYSDGLKPIIFSNNFQNKLKKQDIGGLNKLCDYKVKSEGTLVIISL
jgi:serine/threonine protein phosphatase PrpC|tara:strand:+ start:2151 stop:2945 length:795 start_codon:yes stop_codon:yes gene_type:complete